MVICRIQPIHERRYTESETQVKDLEHQNQGTLRAKRVNQWRTRSTTFEKLARRDETGFSACSRASNWIDGDYCVKAQKHSCLPSQSQAVAVDFFWRVLIFIENWKYNLLVLGVFYEKFSIFCLPILIHSLSGCFGWFLGMKYPQWSIMSIGMVWYMCTGWLHKMNG